MSIATIVSDVANTVVVLTAASSAWCWFKSARVNIPWSSLATLGGPARHVMTALSEQSRWNRAAAGLAAVAGFAQMLKSAMDGAI